MRHAAHCPCIHLGGPSGRERVCAGGNALEPRLNGILSQLSHDELQWLLPSLQMVSLSKNQVLFAPGQLMDHYLFPVSGVIALSIALDDGNVGDTAMVDRDSMYPLHLIGTLQSPNTATVKVPGLCYKVPAQVFHDLLQRSRRLIWVLLSMLARQFEKSTLESVCLRHHTLQQITAKLILISMDQAQSSELVLTHEEMANAIGARREGVSLALKEFKSRKMIGMRRGSVRVLDRAGIESLSCECYKTLQCIEMSGT